MLWTLIQILVLLVFLLGIRIWQRSVRRKRQSHFIIERNVYLLAVPAVAIVLLPSVIRGETDWVAAYFILCAAGTINEGLVGRWWHYFTGTRLWTYYFDPIFNRYASSVGILPWGIGGFVFLRTVAMFAPAVVNGYRFLGYFFALAALLVLQQWIAARVYPARKHGLTFSRLLFLFYPLVILSAAFVAVYGSYPLLIIILAACLLVAIEYFFGKYIEDYMGGKLWSYHTWAVADGHFTPITIPLAVYSGFLAIALFQGTRAVLQALSLL